MQVSQIVEQEDFAVVGGGEARAFQIGNNAQAFKILSDSLYSNKHRALVREVLCNAVDAHIEAGIPERPVEVGLSDCELTIQDFGPGIPDDRMIEIYATYFGSTKQHDNALTGGFGLGSKSPFAYTEHFTVTSCHAGVRRVYALMISDEDADGAPAVKLMANAPCGDAHGLTVSVPIKSEDERQFRDQIRIVVKEGGMIAALNGERLPTRDYTELRKHGIGLFGGYVHGTLPVQVLYGNVLYPVGDNPAIDKYRRKLEKWRGNGYDLIVSATPSSVSVTPSRESLSYNPRTIATMRRLLRRAVHLLEANKGKMNRAAVTAFIERTKMTRATAAHTIRHHVSDTGRTPFTAIIGAPEIARFHAEHAIANHDYPLKKFLDQAGRYFGDRPRLLTKLVEPTRFIVGDRGYRHRLSTLSDFQEQHQFVTRKLLRMVPASLWRQLQYINTNSSTGTPSMMRVRKLNRLHTTRTMADPLNLFIAYSRDAALLKGKQGYYLIAPKITDEEIAAIKADARMFSFKVEVLAKIAPIVKPRKPKIIKVTDKYRALDFNGQYFRPRGGDSMRALLEPTIDMPLAYLAWAPTRHKRYGLAIRSSSNTQELFAAINKQIPCAVLAVGLREVETLKKAGVPSVESIVFTRLEAQLAADPLGSALRAAFLTNKERRNYWGYRSNHSGHLFHRLLTLGPRLAHAALGVPFDKTNKHEVTYEIWTLAASLFESNDLRRGAQSDAFDHKAAIADIKTYQEIHERAKKGIDPSITKLLKKANDGDLDKSDLPHLIFYAKILKSDDLRDLDDADKTRLAEMIEAEIARLNPQSQTGDASP